MSWWALEVRPEPSEQEAVAEWLVGVTGHGVEERDGVLITVAPDAASADRRNGAAAARFIAGDAATLAPLAGPVNLLLSNILRTVNETLLDSIRGSLLPGGIAILSGMEQEESSLFLSALDQAGYVKIDEVIDDAWWAVAARTR